MTDKELKLAAHFLDLASDEFGNHGCNDVEESVWHNWTREERERFVKEFYEHNGDPENFDPEHLHLGDYAIMSLLSQKLINEAQRQ